jgi:PKD repeat protein
MTRILFSCLFFSSFIGIYAQSLTVIWPKHNEVISDRTPLLSWNGMEGIQSYHISLSQDSTFSSGVQTFASSITQFQLSNNLVSGTWFWRVSGAINGQTYFSNLGKVQVFEPMDIPNLIVWLSSDSSVILDVNNRVSSWNNLVGVNHFINNSSSNRPYVTNPIQQLNNFSTIDFQGNNNLISTNNFSLNNCSIFMVGCQNSGDPTYGRFIDHNVSSGFWIGKGPVSVNSIGGGFLESSFPFGNYITISDNSFLQLSMLRENSITSSFFNGVNFTQPTRLTNSNTTSSNKISLGGSIYNDAFGKKKIANVLIYNTNLNTNNKKLVEKYQMDKYAPPVNLGADITPIYQNNGSCVNETITASIMYTNFLWSTGATTQSIQVTQPGSYWVQTTDIFGRTSRDTIVVNNPKMNIFNFQDTIVCFNTTTNITPEIPSNLSIVKWNNCNPNLTNEIKPNNAYFIELTDNQGCIIKSNLFSVGIDSTLANITLGADTNLCSGNTIQLQNTPANITQYDWNTGNTQASQIVDTSGLYMVEVFNSNNCQNRDTIQVTVIGTSPTLNYSFPASICQFSEGQYNDSSEVPNDNGTINNKTWSISEGSSYSGSSGTFVIDTAGTFNVTLLVETEQGCSSTTTFPLVVHPKPVISFTTQNYCPYEEIEFTPLNSTLLTLNSFLWNFNQNNNSSTASNPIYSFGQTDTYNVSLQAQDINGCRDTVVQAVFIQPAPVADFTFNNTCELSAVNFVNNSSIADTFSVVSNQWSYGDGTQATNPSFQKVYQEFGDYDVQLVVTANNGCQDTLAQTITIHPKPILGWQVGPACKNTWTTFENQSAIPIGNIAETDWLVNLQYPLEGTSSAYKFVTTGVQYLNLTSTSDQGCTTDTLIIVNVQPEINASYSVSPTTVVAGVPVVFTNNSLGGTSYEWNLGNNTIYQTPVAEPVEATGFASSFIGDSILTYLAIQNAIGCKDTAYQYVKVNEPRIDLAINQLFVQDINGFYKVGVELRNLGFVEITQTDLLLKLYNSSPILETETEALAPGESRIYLFNANPSAFVSTQDNEISYLCVEATSYNDYQLIETELSNNISCLNTEGGNFVLLPIYPNPTNDDITYTLIVSEESTISTSLTDETGRIVQSSTELYVSGIHTPTISMRNLRAGVYYFHISDGVTSKTVKVLKN